MKLWQKGTAAVLLLSMILLQSVAFASERSVAMQRKIDRLVAFGILSQMEEINDSPITRGEMADLVVRATNNVVGPGKGMSYEDVPASHPKSGAIEVANSLGYVRETDDKMFYPDRQVTKEEAVAMVCNAMGYADIAISEGGYPRGYLKLANDQNITKGVVNSRLTKEDAVLLISNMMDAGVVTQIYNESGMAAVISSKVTFLEDTFNVIKYKVELKEVDTTNRRIVAKFINGDQTGKTREVIVSERVDLQTIGTKATIYMDEDDFELAVYLETRGAGATTPSTGGEPGEPDQAIDSGVICDFISATNRNDLGVVMTLAEWKNVTFTNADRTYKIDDNAIITYEDRTLTTEAYNYVGMFCKAVVQDTVIVRMDIYPMTEGGIIYRADNDELRFSVGTSYENYWQGFSKAPDLQIYIDGKISNKLQDLKSNMVFDYWYGGGQKFIIVASSRVARGVLSDMDSEYMIIGGIEYRISEPYGWYSFSAEDLSFIPGDIENVFGMEVTAYIDDNQRVRYVLPEIGKDKTQKFKGFIVRTYGDPEDAERSIKIHRVDGVGVETYPVREKLKNSSLTFEYAQSVQANLDALGFLEFTLDDNGEISKIEKIDNFGDDVRSHTKDHGSFSESYHLIGGLYADEANIYALMEIDGAFTVKHVSYTHDLSWTKPGPEGVKVISDFNLRENPIADYIVLGRGSETICDVANQFDIIESVKWTGEDDIYNIKFLGGDTFDVDKAFIDRYNLKKNCMVRYGEKNLGKFRIHITDVIDLSGDPESWAVGTYETGAHDGFYRANGIIERNHDAIQFMANGVHTDLYLYRNDNTAGYYAMKIYELLGNGKIQKARDSAAVGTNIAWYIRPVLKYPVMNIQKGDDVWFNLYDDNSGLVTIDYIIYRSNNKFFE